MMQKLSALAAASAALALLAAPATAEERPKGEAKLAQMLEGRVAGEAERCIRLMGSDPLTIIDGTAVVAKRGDTIWVNRTANPESLDDNDRMTIRKFSASQLCRLDQVTTYDRYGDFYTGNIMLQDFVPYRRSEG
jgi:hypothetical protein